MRSSNYQHVTLQDVARLAGVSAKTVSRVVNHQGEISEDTRKRVQSTIDQLGYRPNILARSLVSQRTNSLGVVTSGLEYYGPSHTLAGIEQQSYDLGYSLLFSLLPKPDANNIAPILDPFISRRVDGIIWAVPEIGQNRAWIQPGLVEKLPPIVFLSMAERPGLSIVAIDNKSGGAQATQHLVDLGRRCIGLITGPMDWWEARERFSGWKETLQRNNLDHSALLTVEGDWSAAGGNRCMRELLDRRPDIDAVFASNDQMALGALGVLHQLGRRIPEDIAIAGFDNIPESACFWPPLTTIQHQLFDAGSRSVQILQQLIEGKQATRNLAPTDPILLSTKLIIRASSVGFS
jgi:LacI family transcriptional regulator